MMQIKLSLLLLFIFCGCQSLGQFQNQKHHHSLRKTFPDFRESAPQFWSELQKYKTQDDIFNHLGLGVGDAHILNFGFLETNGPDLRHVSVIDFDDNYSKTPLFGDWLRFYKGAELFSSAVKAGFEDEEIWQAYVSGLQGMNFSAPRFIEDIQNLSRTDYEVKQNKYLKKFHSNNKFTSKAELSPLDSSAPPEITKLYHNNKTLIEGELASFSILDKGYYVKASGGSKNQARFWYLVKNKAQVISVKEFKHLSLTPSPLYYHTTLALPLPERYNDLAAGLQTALKTRASLQSLKILKSPSDLFLMRDKSVKLFECDPEESMSSQEIKECLEVLKYESYLMGELHRKSNLTYSEQILKSPNNYQKLTFDLNSHL